MQKLIDLQTALDSAKVEGEKFEKGNKAAGTRLRALMQDIKNLAQDVRVEVQSKKKG